MTSASKPKKSPGPPDWESIERGYRAGVLSLREIAKAHGVSDTAIRKKAKRDGWARDLTEKVQAAARAELVRTQVRTPNARAREAPTEREIVDEAKETVVDVVHGHRSDTSKARKLLDTLIQQLSDAAGNRDALEEIILEATSECEDPTADKGAQQRAWTRRGQMLKAVSLPTMIAAARDATTAMEKIHTSERRAHNISDGFDPAPPAEPQEAEPMTDEYLAAYAQRLSEITGVPSALTAHEGPA